MACDIRCSASMTYHWTLCHYHNARNFLLCAAYILACSIQTNVTIAFKILRVCRQIHLQCHLGISACLMRSSRGKRTVSGQKPLAPIKATLSLKNGSSIAITAVNFTHLSNTATALQSQQQKAYSAVLSQSRTSAALQPLTAIAISVTSNMYH